MNNKTTLVLAICAVVLVGGVIGVGAVLSQPAAPKPTVQEQPKPVKPTLSQDELMAQLTIEQPAITSAIVSAFPDITKLYTVNKGSLYEAGQWYGATLTYSGDSTYSDQRDTLRIVLEKKDGAWKVRTNPPQVVLNIRDLPDVPKSVLQAINKPAPLPAAGDSPAIIPTQ